MIDHDFTLLQGDARQLVCTLPPSSVDCVVTSPPYYGLRDYGTGSWEGGTDDCSHEAARKKTRYDYSLARSPIQDGSRSGTDARPALFAEVCPVCGARRVDDQLGLESTPDDYVYALMEIFSNLKAALTPAATVWVNIGDSYDDGELLGIPWKFAFVMRGHGYRLVRDVIWSKPNPMPESATNRPNTSHEYLFMFTKTKRHTFDMEAVKEPSREEVGGRRHLRSVWEIPTAQLPDAHFAPYPEDLVRRCVLASCPPGGVVLDPFLGTGTTAIVARQEGRKCIGIELNPEYCDLIKTRTAQLSLLTQEASW